MTIPIGFLCPETEPPSHLVKRFKWISNTGFKVINNEGFEKVFEITKDGLKVVAFSKIPMLDI